MAKIHFLLMTGLLATFSAFAQLQDGALICADNDISLKLPRALVEFKEKNLIRVNPFFIDIYQKHEGNNFYTIEFFEKNFIENGRFHDFNFLQAEPRVAHLLMYLRHIARETNSYIYLNPAGFKLRTCYKTVTEKNNLLHHDERITTRKVNQRFYEIAYDEDNSEDINWNKIKLTFRPSGEPLPAPKKYSLRADDLKETYIRNGFLWLNREVTGYTLKVKNQNSVEHFRLGLDQINESWALKLKDLWKQHGNTVISFNEYLFHPMANDGVDPEQVFAIENVHVEPANVVMPTHPVANDAIYATMVGDTPFHSVSENATENMPPLNDQGFLDQQRIYEITARMNGAFVPTTPTSTNTEI